MEQLKHECGIALIRLKKPTEYYCRKYGTSTYGLNKLYLLMEKQHNRGQEGAGLACVSLSAGAGEEFMFRERKEGKNAIAELFEDVFSKIKESNAERCAGGEISKNIPFVGDCYMGHLRYSTTGRSGISYVHPFLRRANYRANTLAMCGNFNLTNIDHIFAKLTSEGQHPRRTSDTTVLLEQLGHLLDEHTAEILNDISKQQLQGNAAIKQLEQQVDVAAVLAKAMPDWDGGYVMCGMTGSGNMYAVRDPRGIRPAFCYEDDEIVVVASERPVIQTVMDVSIDSVHEIPRGAAVVIAPDGEASVRQIAEPLTNTACVFERIYFSRGGDRDIYLERKALGRAVVPRILDAIDGDIRNSVFSFIPNTAETAFMGMHEGLDAHLNSVKTRQIKELPSGSPDRCLVEILSQQVRLEKVAVKDIKLRTFISESGQRNDLANHVYDITYGTIVPGVDNLVVIDDSIVRGTTLRQSIITILARLKPRKLVIVSSAPQIRYPDFYGIDMSNIEELIAFRSAVALSSRELLDDIYGLCKQQEQSGVYSENHIKRLYEHLTADQISAEIARQVTPQGLECEVQIIFQDLESLAHACPDHPGDWYFSGEYPTEGGVRLLSKTFIKFYENSILPSMHQQ